MLDKNVQLLIQFCVDCREFTPKQAFRVGTVFARIKRTNNIISQ